MSSTTSTMALPDTGGGSNNVAAEGGRSSHDQPRFTNVRRDIERFRELDADGATGCLAFLRLLANSPGLQAVLVYRFGCWTYQSCPRPLRTVAAPLYFLLHKLMIVCWGIHIDRRAEIGAGLYIGHFGGVIIGAVRIGEDCNVGHNVTIGRRADGDSGAPVLGARVWIGTGCVVAGALDIGDGVTIGPLTVVTRRLPTRVLVQGNPMRVIETNHDNFVHIYGRPRRAGELIQP